MKDTTKRWGSLFLCLAQLCGLLSIPVVAAASGEATPIEPIFVSYTNSTQEPGLEQETACEATALADVEYCDTIQAAGEIVRAQMVARQTYITVGLRADYVDESQLHDIIAAALVHTGVPTEGDYLRWQFQGWKGSITGYIRNQVYYLTVTYELAYYSSAEQEALVDAGIAQLLSELDVKASGDYEKVKAVYDWMCRNITYDYANLNDSNYLLKYTAYAALVNGTSVCQGYSNLFYRLCLELGLDCRICFGQSLSNGTKGNHTWNLVCVDGQFYYVDTTWGSVLVDGGPNYDYLLKCESSLDTHQLQVDPDYPELDASRTITASDEDYEVPGEIVIIASGLHDSGPVAWQITSDGTLTITGNRSIQSKLSYDWAPYSDIIKKIVISDGITTIPEKAFTNMSNVTQVSIGNTVEYIGISAFSGCTALESVAIPGSVNEIDKSAFNGCRNLQAIEFTSDSQLVSVGQYAFQNTGIVELSLPASVRIIDQYAFSDCQQLTAVNFTEGLEVISHHAFDNCTSLTGHLYLPSTITTIGVEPFSGANSWTSVEINTPESSSLSLADNPNLQSVVIGGNIIDLGNGLFKNCTGLTSVTFHSPVESIGWSTFEGCTSLSSIKLPQTLTTIHNHAFQNTGLTEIVIPDSVTEIGMSAFSNCEKLTSATLGSGMDQLSNFAFEGCPNLKHVDLGSTRLICCSAFENCGSLNSIEIPATVQSIQNGAFMNCICLSEIIFMGDAPSFGSNKDCFAGVTADVRYYPAKESWTTDVMLDYGGNLTWIAYAHTYVTVITSPTCTEGGYTTHTCSVCGDSYVDGKISAMGHDWVDADDGSKTCTVCGVTEGGYRIALDASVVGDASSVWIDGAEYTLYSDGSGFYVNLAQPDATNLVVYTCNNPEAEDVHTQYPTGMKVWILEYEKGTYTTEYVAEFDNLLQYSGSSIRIAGVKGIRMITSIDKSKKRALTSTGLADYTLVEYGTALAWASDLEGGNPLTLGQPYTKSNYAYKKDEADPVFKTTADLIQYTNVLVGFNDDQCIPDIAMRPYIILEDADGNQVTIYGGIIYRSIGYIAYQNRNAFQPGSGSYEYVWSIIHHVYGDQYDAEYKR